jgi:hypothetical protein
MTLRYGKVGVFAEHKIFKDDHDYRADIRAIDHESTKDVRDVIEIMRTRMNNFHIIEAGLRKIIELIFHNEKEKKYIMGEEFDGKPTVSGDFYRVIVECIYKNMKHAAVCSYGFHCFKHLCNSPNDERRQLYRDGLVNCGCSQVIVDGIKMHLDDPDVCLFGVLTLRLFAFQSESVTSEIKHFGGIEACELMRAEYFRKRPKIHKEAGYLLATLQSLSDNSLYMLEVECQRLRRQAAQPNATVADKVAAAKAQAAIQLSKMSR